MIDIFVINLEKNKDRKQFIIDSYDKYFNLHFIDAVYDKTPAKGCFLSHIKCVQHAKDNNMEYIIVMEDDCQNRNDNFANELEDILIYLKQNKEKWDIFLGGTTNVYPHNIIQKESFNNMNFCYLKKGFTTHFIIYNSKCYDFFLNRSEFKGTPIDRIWEHKLIACVKVPFIFFQKPCYSDIQSRNIDYTKALLKAENRLNGDWSDDVTKMSTKNAKRKYKCFF